MRATVNATPPEGLRPSDEHRGLDAPGRLASEEYLSVKQLATRIPYSEQTIRNLMSRGIFRLGVHYVKPLGKGRPIFKWSAVQAWLEGRS